MPAFGLDLHCVEDLDELMSEVAEDDVTGLSEAIARRLSTPRGALIDDENYGIDLSDYLSGHVNALVLAQLRGEAQTEVLKEERVATCEVSVEVTGAAPELVLLVNVRGQADVGPYDLTLSVDKVTVALLTPSGA